MKWMMAIGAVLAMPALVFGYVGTANFTLESSGNTSITIDPGDPFSLDIAIDWSGAENIYGDDAALTASTSNVFMMTSRTHGSGVSGNITANRTDAVILSDANKWLKTAADATQDLGGEFQSTEWTQNPLQYSTIGIDSADAIAPGVYTITMGSPGLAGLNVLEGVGLEFMDTSSDTFTVTVTPEPASMLLLVGALPFLRRRRSA